MIGEIFKREMTMRKTILLLAAAALSLTACQFQETEKPETGDVSILFHAVTETPTRTAFGEKQDGAYPAYWTANDTQVKLALNYTTPLDAAVTPSADGTKATFGATFSPESASSPYVFNALSPASAVKSLSPSREAWSIDIPATQTPLPGSVDESAMLLWARSPEASVFPDEMDLTFHHLTAYGLLTLTNVDLGDGTVQRVEITATTPLAGSWYFGCEDGSLVSNGASSTLTLYTSSLENIWFACAPVDVSGEILVFTVYTEDAVFVKEVEMPQNRSFTSGRVARMSVDFTGIAPEEGTTTECFVLVKNVNDLQVDDEIIIANVDGNYGLGPKNTSGQTPYRQAVAITVENEIITNAGNATVLTLKSGSSSGTWAFKASEGYLTTTTTRNSLSTSNNIGDTSSWTITIDSSGKATVVAKSGYYPYLRYNPNNGNSGGPRFSAYGETSSVQNPVAIYHKVTINNSVTPEEDPLTAQSEYGYYFTDATRSYAAGTDQYSREYDGQNGVTFAILNPADNEQVEIMGYRTTLIKGDSVTISVAHRRGRTSVFEGNYPLTVVKEEGAKVWLGDGSGNGVIIKK